jgi:drug/metabolite transporter, DME family
MFSSYKLASPGVICVLAAAMLWGTTGTIQGLLPVGREPIVVATLRVTLGAAALWAISLLARVPLGTVPSLPWWRIGGAGTAIAGYNLFFFHGVARAGVGVGTALALGSGPLWVLAWEFLRTGTIPSAHRLRGQAIATAGLIVLMAGGLRSGGSGVGYAFSTMAGLAYGTYVHLTGGFDVLPVN